VIMTGTPNVQVR